MSKRNDLSVQDKIKLLKRYDELPKTSQREAAIKLDVSQPFLCKLLKNRYDIEVSSTQNEQRGRKRKRSGQNNDVDQALKEWFFMAREKNLPISGPLLKTKAEELARIMNKTDFRATNGWFSRWLKRENITYVTPHGEQGDADHAAADEWIQNVWPTLASEYPPSSIFNADECGLYFRALPENTFAFKYENIRGFKISKERITLLCCVSMSGEKKELLVIGKSKRPHCFIGVKQLPLTYFSNKNAWMTSSIFSEWLKNWDKSLDRNILLLIDQCSAHKNLPSLKRIRVVFLPANTTSLIQPCDQGIIRALKAYYRNEMRLRVLQLIDSSNLNANDIAKKLTLLTAMHLCKKAWDSVTEVTVSHLFICLQCF